MRSFTLTLWDTYVHVCTNRPCDSLTLVGDETCDIVLTSHMGSDATPRHKLANELAAEQRGYYAVHKKRRRRTRAAPIDLSSEDKFAHQSVKVQDLPNLEAHYSAGTRQLECKWCRHQAKPDSDGYAPAHVTRTGFACKVCHIGLCLGDHMEAYHKWAFEVEQEDLVSTEDEEFGGEEEFGGAATNTTVEVRVGGLSRGEVEGAGGDPYEFDNSDADEVIHVDQQMEAMLGLSPDESIGSRLRAQKRTHTEMDTEPSLKLGDVVSFTQNGVRLASGKINGMPGDMVHGNTIRPGYCTIGVYTLATDAYTSTYTMTHGDGDNILGGISTLNSVRINSRQVFPLENCQRI